MLGCYDEENDKWKTVTKCANGLDDDTLVSIQSSMRNSMVQINKNFESVPDWLDITRAQVPDFIAKDPKEQPVWECMGTEWSKSTSHTANGISIRFPRIIKFRDDKDWSTATNLKHLKEIVEASNKKEYSPGVQKKGKEKKSSKKAKFEFEPEHSPSPSNVSKSMSKSPSKKTKKESKKEEKASKLKFVQTDVLNPFRSGGKDSAVVAFFSDESSDWPNNGIFSEMDDKFPDLREHNTEKRAKEEFDTGHIFVVTEKVGNKKLYFF